MSTVKINQKLPKAVILRVEPGEIACLMQRTGLPRQVVAKKLEELVPSYLTLVADALEDSKLEYLREQQAKIKAELEAALTAVEARSSRALPGE